MILDKVTRTLIYRAGSKPVEITWPKDAPEPKVGHKYTIQTSAGKPGEARFIVDSFRELANGRIVATVHVDADPIRLLGKSGGYTSAPQGAIGTRVAPDPEGFTGPRFRPEVEPEAVDEETQRRFSTEARHNRAQFQAELAEENEDLARELVRKREHVARDELRRLTKGLEFREALALLAAIEREIKRAADKEAA